MQPQYIQQIASLSVAGPPPMLIEEFIGRRNSGNGEISIARLKGVEGFIEPGQTPDFDEYTVVLRGILHVEMKDAAYDVQAGQSIVVPKGHWVRYGTPYPEGAEYIAVCVPAYSFETAHVDAP